jgi:hypothetical protein
MAQPALQPTSPSPAACAHAGDLLGEAGKDINPESVLQRSESIRYMAQPAFQRTSPSLAARGHAGDLLAAAGEDIHLAGVLRPRRRRNPTYQVRGSGCPSAKFALFALSCRVLQDSESIRYMAQAARQPTSPSPAFGASSSVSGQPRKVGAR